ncbi:hypothetical protein BDW59DRAFT_107301 [Aspergillus cavernicola]|uniref:DUF8035 domain-containing protein n=1 Tax=Aspergillus cavernicola TaxID=176166 RepID=A0ABR4I360_9EURO
MPRRTRPTEYDDRVIDDMEHEMYPTRAKGEPLLVDRDARYDRRTPKGPVVEIQERRHIRDRAKPEIPRESYEYLRDDEQVVEKLGRLDLDAHPREEIVDSSRRKKYSTHSHKGRGRPRSTISDVEETYFTHDESEGRYTDSESDEIEDLAQRSKRPISRHEYGARKEHLPRSKSLKEERHVKLSKYDEDVYPKSSHPWEDHAGSRQNLRRDAVPRPRHRSHYHINLEEEDAVESEDSEEDAVPRHRRRKVTRRDGVKQKYAARSRETSSSSSSSSESESESELPKVPLPVPVPPVYKGSSRRLKSLSHATAYRLPSPPRVPSLETVLNEREARHRKRREIPTREEVEIERRSKESLKLPHEHHSRRRKEDAVIIDEQPDFAGHRDVMIESQRTGPSRSKKREIVEEDYYRPRDPKPPSWSPPSSETMDGWAIVQAPCKSKYTAETEVVDIHGEPRLSRHKHRAKAAENEERDLGASGDTPRGKVGRRYIGVKDRRDRLWTEITKDLVVREAIERAGYEYEETDGFYYIFSNLHPDDVSGLIEHTDEIRRARRRRIKEIHRERASLPPSSRRAANKSAPVPPDQAPSPPRLPREPSPPRHPQEPSPPRRYREDRRRREREEEIEESGHWRGHSGRW